MSLTEKLRSIKTRVDNLENAIDSSGVLDSTDGTIINKVNLLIEKAQNAGGENGAIDYPEWGFTRPAWWLPRPELTEGDKVNECFYLDEVEADTTEYMGVDTSNLEILPNGKKQFWRHYLVKKNSGARYDIPADPHAIELIINCVSIPTTEYRYQAEGFTRLQVVTGTPFSTGNYYQDSLASKQLRVFDCKFIHENAYNGSLLANCTSLTKQPITEWGNQKAAYVFQNCNSLIEASIDRGTSLAGAFNNCWSLEKVHLGAKCKGLNTETFNKCARLRIVTVGEGFSASLYIHHSTQFPAEVLHAIIENYADMTGQTAPTFQAGATNLAKIDDEHKAMLEAKNINYL